MRLLILLISIVTMAGCGIKKELSKTKLQLQAAIVKEKETQDSNRLLKSEVATYQAAMKESEYGEIEFVPEAAPCNCDSNKSQPAPTTIEKKSDGTITVTGPLKKAKLYKTVMVDVKATYQKTIDSLSNLLTKERAKVKIDQTVKNVEVKKKVEVFPWWMWWLLIAAIGLGWWLKGKFGGTVTTFIKHLKEKW